MGRKKPKSVTGDERSIRAMAAYIRKHSPPLLPFRVYIRDPGSMPNLDGFDHTKLEGLCQLSYDKNDKPLSFSIYIQRGTLTEMADALIHESAHMHAWTADDTVDDHDAMFGIQKARIYRLIREMDA